MLRAPSTYALSQKTSLVMSRYAQKMHTEAIVLERAESRAKVSDVMVATRVVSRGAEAARQMTRAPCDTGGCA